MADKQATVYIVDLGESMGASHNGRIESDVCTSYPFVVDTFGLARALSLSMSWITSFLDICSCLIVCEC